MAALTKAIANCLFRLLLFRMEYSSSNVNELPSALLDNTRSSSFSPDSMTKVSLLSSFFRESLDDVESCDCRGCDMFLVWERARLKAWLGGAVLLKQIG